MRRYSVYWICLLAVAVSAGFCARHAHASDLGEGCCAGLEERIAEREATTARKGNRNVTLSISGYVAQEITWWNDGSESNAYLHGLGPTQATHAKFDGQAVIQPGWTAGYLMRIQSLEGNPFGRSGVVAMDQDSDDFSQGLNLQMSYWYLASKALGTVSLGKLAPAAKSAAMFTDKSGTQVIENYTFLDGFPQFITRSGDDLAPAALTWGQLAYCYSQNVPLGGDCDGLVMNAVRYDSPMRAGFSVSASWGEDDDWQVAGRYAGEIFGFRVLLGIGYSESTDENLTVPLAGLIEKDSSYFQAGGYAEHIASGLFVHGAYGYEDNSGTLLAGGVTPPDGEHWYAKAGIRGKWTPLGATVIYGDFGRYGDQLGPAALVLGITSSELDQFGGGVVQELDAASMSIWLKYREQSAEIAGPGAIGRIDDLRTVSTGALFSF
ncbi:MAG: porin [Xanthobacteraceae bacterium]